MLTGLQEKGFSSMLAIPWITGILLLSGCANQQIAQYEMVEVDPYEGFNRTMFGFNETVDTYVAEPISDAYIWVTPRFVQTGVSNFFDNLKGVNIVLNDFMQGKGKQGAEDAGRFLINSTIGIFGLFDVASKIGLEQNNEDFAQTLAVWGVSSGPYLVLPLLGPTTTRGIPGGIFDAAANPATYVAAPVQLLNVLNARANADAELNFIKEAALDPYVFTRESFLQYRNNLIKDGKFDDIDDLLDFDEDFDDEADSENTVDLQLDKTTLSSEAENKGVLAGDGESDLIFNNTENSVIDLEKLNQMEVTQ